MKKDDRKPMTVMVAPVLYRRIKMAALMQDIPIYQYLEEKLEDAVHASEVEYAEKIK